jgi:hypothetical protein
LGLAGLDIGQGYAPLFGPINQRPADTFRAIVDPNGQGLTSPLNDPIKSADNTRARPNLSGAGHWKPVGKPKPPSFNISTASISRAEGIQH